MSTTFQITQGDVAVSRSSGQPQLVADGIKLRQDLRLAMGSGARRENVGAGLEDVVNGRSTTASQVEREIQRRVRAMTAAMQDLQSQYNRAFRPAAERLVRLITVQVSTVKDDPTAFFVRAEFLTAGNGRVALNGRLT